jgi:hypothetical protein
VIEVVACIEVLLILKLQLGSARQQFLVTVAANKLRVAPLDLVRKLRNTRLHPARGRDTNLVGSASLCTLRSVFAYALGSKRVVLGDRDVLVLVANLIERLFVCNFRPRNR